MQQDHSRVVNFWRENKNRANWCAHQSEGIPVKTTNLILLTLYVLLKLTYFYAEGIPVKTTNLILLTLYVLLKLTYFYAKRAIGQF